MTEGALVEKKLARILQSVQELRSMADPATLGQDLRTERFVLYTLQTAIQAALDVASHVVSDDRLGEPRTNAELFILLQRAGWVPLELLPHLRAMVGFRNVVVHGYDDVDLSIVREILTHHLSDLERFVEAVRARLG